MIRMDEKFNWGRVLFGGVMAGIAMNIISGLVNMPILNVTYEDLLAQGVYEKVPRYPFIVFHMIGLFLLGIVLAWLYAVARHRLGRGPKSALVVGIVVGFVAAVPSSLNQASWDPAPYLGILWSWWLIGAYVKVIVGTFIAAAIYTEEEEEEEAAAAET